MGKSVAGITGSTPVGNVPVVIFEADVVSTVALGERPFTCAAWTALHAAFPFAAMPVAYCPVEQDDGTAARAFAVAAFPVVLALMVAGNCEAANVPIN
jgi:hypothetical protein